MAPPGPAAAGTLFIVATPIGNLEDVTLRALRVLREAAVIAAEDTRRTARLLSHFGIATPTTSFFEHNEREKIPQLLARLAAGDLVALVSDAGTPGVSDPGYRLVRAALDSGVRVDVIPGPSAVLAALVASGLSTSTFRFAGFPPSKARARDAWLQALSDIAETTVFFEAPHRVLGTLTAAARVLGDRPIAVCRELTKAHESVVRGRLPEIVGRLDAPRGEYTIVLGPADKQPQVEVSLPSDSRLLDEFRHLTEVQALDRRDAVSRLRTRYMTSSREIYSAIERAKNSIE